MKAETKYSEKERLVAFKHLAAFNLNPFAAWIVFEEYAKNCHPLPIRYEWAGIELEIKTAGYLGKQRGNAEKCDLLAMKLLMQSYKEQLALSALPVSFQLANAVEFHLRIKGMSEFDKKNPMREIFNPT